MKKRNCPTCKKPIAGNVGNKQYCSAKCRPKKEDFELACKHCGKLFLSKIKARFYCSKACVKEVRQEEKKRKVNPYFLTRRSNLPLPNELK